MIIDFHVHSIYSDSPLRPEEIIKTARRKGLDGVAITDHNTIRGGVIASKFNADEKFKVIVGSEMSTEYGHILGLFLKEEVKSRKFVEAVDEIKGQGGLVALAHPFAPFNANPFPEELLDRIDLVEFNGMLSHHLNRKALKMAKRHKIPVIAGSDAHFPFQIGRARTILPNGRMEDLLNGEAEIAGRGISPLFILRLILAYVRGY
jgi:predicted metal-dependent phosphoesterase TrpH